MRHNAYVGRLCVVSAARRSGDGKSDVQIWNTVRLQILKKIAVKIQVLPELFPLEGLKAVPKFEQHLVASRALGGQIGDK